MLACSFISLVCEQTQNKSHSNSILVQVDSKKNERKKIPAIQIVFRDSTRFPMKFQCSREKFGFGCWIIIQRHFFSQQAPDLLIVFHILTFHFFIFLPTLANVPWRRFVIPSDLWRHLSPGPTNTTKMACGKRQGPRMFLHPCNLVGLLPVYTQYLSCNLWNLHLVKIDQQYVQNTLGQWYQSTWCALFRLPISFHSLWFLVTP